MESQKKIYAAIGAQNDKEAHDEMRALLKRNYDMYDKYFKSLLVKG